jgi:hypothetical protein
MLDALHHMLRGTGRRRAADYIPVVEAERDYWKARCAALQQRLASADDLLIGLVCTRDRLERELAQAVTDRDVVLDAHRFLLDEHDELAHRHTELRMELANARSVSAPAPADHAPAVPSHDPEATAELAVSTLWDAHGLRPLVRTA